MIKKLFAIFIVFCICTPAFSATIRNPQGRLGLSYKTEAYIPLKRTNITPEELEKISALIKQEEDKEKENQKKQQKQQQKEIKLAQKEKEKQVKQQQKEIKLAQKEKEKQTKLAQKNTKNKQAEQIEEQQETQRTANFFNKFSKKQNKETTTTTEQKTENNVAQVPQSQEKPEQKPVYNTDYETKLIIEEVTHELSSARPQMLEELSGLWVSAVQKSDTVYFAIMKLSNPNGEEANKKGFKKILEPIIGAAPLVGQAFVNPALTAGSLIGSNVLGTMMNDSATRRLAKVNDADLVILARAIDELQKTLLMNYMAYKNALAEYEFAIKIANERKKVYDKLNQKNSPNLVLASTFYTEALDNQYKARQDFLMKRVVLEQMVGADALHEIEKNSTQVSQNLSTQK